MAANKVVLRTAFSDVFRVGDTEITQEGTEVSSRTKADEILEIARQNGVTLYEVPQDAAPEVKKEGS